MHFAALLFHVLAAAVWVGGTIALVFAGVPTIRKVPVELRPDLFARSVAAGAHSGGGASRSRA